MARIVMEEFTRNPHEPTGGWHEPDWTRETPRYYWDPAYRLMKSIRDYQRAGSGPIAKVRRKYAKLSHRFWSIVTGAEISLTAQIGGGLRLPHPNGVVVHPDTKIGPNCMIFQQVTLGLRDEAEGAPVLGAHVDVGAGAKILGPVHIGDHAVIGANAVVLKDVPEGAVAVGVPARILNKNGTS